MCHFLVWIKKIFDSHTPSQLCLYYFLGKHLNESDLVNVLNNTKLIGLDIRRFNVNSVFLFKISRNLPQLQVFRAVDLGQSVEPYILVVLLKCTVLKSVEVEPCGSSIMWADIVNRYTDTNFGHLILDFIPAHYLKFARIFHVFPRLDAPDLSGKIRITVQIYLTIQYNQ